MSSDEDDMPDFLNSDIPKNPPEDKGRSEKCSWLEEDYTVKRDNNIKNTKPKAMDLASKKSEGNLSSLESNLTLEKRNNARLQVEVERLRAELKEVKPAGRMDIIKYVPEINPSDIKLGDEIGKGGFSSIYKAQWLKIKVAVKEIFDPNVTDDLLDEFYNEIKKLFLVRHPNIINIYGISTKNKKLLLCMELAPKGNLFDLLHKRAQGQEISLEFKFKVVNQLIRTLNYLHSFGFVHRDLKTHNILFDDNYNVKLCDFGLCKSKSELNIGSGQFSGTPIYMAPELFNRKSYDEKVDVFAFGTILWEIFTEKVPYPNCEINDIKKKIINGEQLPIGSSIPKQIAQLIPLCRNIDPSKRPSFKEIASIKFKY